MANPVVHEMLTELVHETHPTAAASFSPVDWAKVIAALEQIVPIIINIFNAGK